MITILDALNKSSEYLTKKGVEDPRINAELLLCSILNCRKLNLYLNYDQPLSDEETGKYRELLKRRGNREPLQYITGTVEFYGITFKVNNTVLIPRPETELLVEKIINENSGRSLRILDIGTGSGNIAICLKSHLPLAEITSVDKSKEALATASLNAEYNSCSGKINFCNIDVWSDEILSLGKFDLIVSNPPYVSEVEYLKLPPELRLHEPKTALSDLSDGLTFYKRIAGLSGNMLNSGGKIYLEMGAGQAIAIQNIFIENNIHKISIIKDYQGIDRIISGEKP
jgi:release factor glutamine methyltransferase